MEKILIWDLPLRIFHWLLAGTFVAAFAIATLSSDDGTLFPLHAVFGLAIPFLLAVRIVWGVIGSRWAKLGSLTFDPRKLVRYFRDAFGEPKVRLFIGHNPATSYFMLAAFFLLAGLAVTGVMMSRGDESVEELHEVFAWTMVALVAFHVAGVAWHTIRHGENLAFAMIDGRKQAPTGNRIHSTRRGSAGVLLVLTALWGAMLVNGYDAASGRITLPFLATPLQVGETEEEEGGEAGAASAHQDDDEDDDD